jgi:hypothetical protein
MADWSVAAGGLFAATGLDANSKPIAVNPSASANTKGAWVTLFASTPFESNMMRVMFSNAAGYSSMVDIAVGAAGYEVVIVPNLAIRAGPFGPIGVEYVLPMCVGEGVRLAARSQSTGTSQTIKVAAMLCGSGFPSLTGFSQCETLGADTSTTQMGAPITLNTMTINTKSSWAQLTAATVTEIQAISIAIGARPSATADAARVLDVGIGAAGSEVVLIPDLTYQLYYDYNVGARVIGPLPCRIPAGSRLACRVQANTSITEIMYTAVYGFS